MPPQSNLFFQLRHARGQTNHLRLFHASNGAASPGSIFWLSSCSIITHCLTLPPPAQQSGVTLRRENIELIGLHPVERQGTDQVFPANNGKPTQA